MANSEWVLGVQVQHFQTLYNAEIRNGQHCCCDISYMDVACVQDLGNLDVTACTFECEPLFDIHFKVCFTNGTCLYMKNEISCTHNNPTTWITPLLLELYLNESMIKNIMNVSAKKAIFKCTSMNEIEQNGSVP